MAKYVVQMSKEGGETFQILDKTAREEIAREAAARNTAISEEEQERVQDVTRLQSLKVPYPAAPKSKYGTAGQLLKTLGDGRTEWVDEGLPTDEQTAQAVSAWLDDHPEATTSVEDRSLTLRKLTRDTQDRLTSMGTPSSVLKYVKGDLPFNSSIQSFCKANGYFYVGGFSTGYIGYIVEIDSNGNTTHTFTYEGAEFSALTSDGEYLYAVIARTSATDTSNEILKIDPEDWSYDVLTFGESQVIAAYYYKNELYVQDVGMTIYKFSDGTELCTIPDLEADQHRQTFMMDDDYIYEIYSLYPQIGKFDYSGNFIGCIDIGSTTSDGYMPIYELENGYIDDETGNFIIGANGIAERRGGNKTLAVYEVSVTHNLLVPDRYQTYGTKYTIYADKTASWERPTGSWGRSYPLLAYAILSASLHNAVVSGKGDYDFEGVYTLTTDLCIRNVNVTGFHIIRAKVELDAISMTGRSNNMAVVGEDTVSVALTSIGSCEITMTNCSIDENEQGEKSDYITYLSGGTRFYNYGFTNSVQLPQYASTTRSIDGHSTMPTNEINRYMSGFITPGNRITQQNTMIQLTAIEDTNNYSFTSDYLEWSANVAVDGNENRHNESMVAILVIMSSGPWCSWITLASRPNAVSGYIRDENNTLTKVQIRAVSGNQFTLVCDQPINASGLFIAPI